MEVGAPVFQSFPIRKYSHEEFEPYALPVMSDILVVHSSYVGEPSFRDEIRGSWFIQTLCRKINELAQSHDLELILTEVKREIAANRHLEVYNKATGEIDIYKQMPTVTSTLLRKLYLRKFGDKCPLTTFLDLPETSRNTALDFTPTTTMLPQFDPYSCSLDDFDCIQKCLLRYLEENPSDSTAMNFLEISKTFENEQKFDALKEKMTKAIGIHFINNTKNFDFDEYFSLYKY